MDLWFGAVALGLAYAFLGMGVFITMRIYNFPDITADGSLTVGAAITAALLTHGWDPFAVVAVATAGGFLAGTLTGLIHTKLNVNGLLAGILVMTALYSINLRIMGRATMPLLDIPTVITPFAALLPSDSPAYLPPIILFSLLAAAALLFLSFLFRTDFGLAMRATGDNETMIAAQGVSTDRMKIVGIGLSNALIAASGSLVAQYQSFADIGMGIGIVVFGLASVIIGETIAGAFPKGQRMGLRLLCVLLGTILFRELVAVVLKLGLAPSDLKIATAFFVLLAIILPQSKFLTRRKG